MDSIVLSAPLEVLFRHYADTATDTPLITKCFDKLENLLSPLPPSDRETILQAVCTLCENHERLAFREGVSTGIQLAEELSNA